jgi:hypothetical protein
MGSLPLALGMESGGEMMRPLAISVVGGLLFSTLLTLFLVPCAYVIVQRGGDRVKAFLLGPSTRAAVSAETPQVATSTQHQHG